MIKINLSKLLGERRMTQSELAQITGIRPSTICEIYNEVCSRIRIDHLDSICTALDCDITELLTYINSENNS